MLLFITPCIYGQDTTQHEIDMQVWFPFMESYAAFDSEAFIALHTKDVVRISRDGQNITVGKEYFDRILSNEQRNKDSGRKRNIYFSFCERMYSGGTAFETGYYKVISKSKEGKSSISIGRFHVILKKVNDMWRISVDADTSEDQSLTEEDFQKGKVLVRPKG
jgi:ketosteroid isomerase-like protein